jgi:hypothetical protein
LIREALAGLSHSQAQYKSFCRVRHFLALFEKRPLDSAAAKTFRPERSKPVIGLDRRLSVTRTGVSALHEL